MNLLGQLVNNINILKHKSKEAEKLLEAIQEWVSVHIDVGNNCAFGAVIVNKDGSVETNYQTLHARYNLALVGGIEALKVSIINGCFSFENVEVEE